jgi:transposase
MARIRQVELSESDRRLLEQGYLTGENHLFRMRCRAILLKSEGRTSKLVSEETGLCEVTVNTTLDRWESGKLAALNVRPGRGRKSKLDRETDLEQVRRVVQEHRQRLSVAKSILEAEMGKTFSLKTLQRFLKNLVADSSASVAD